MKRFTETTKWSDPWFRKLPPRLKCLWQYLCDTCDAAGVFEIDFEHASFVIGENVSAEDLLKMDGRLEKIGSSKWVILKFIPFQYAKLSQTCPAHKPVFFAMVRNKIGYQYPSDRVTLGIQYPTGTERKGKGQEEGESEGEGNGIAAFNLFWEAYPLKKSKADAEHAFVESMAIDHVPQIIQAIKVQRVSEDWTKEGGKFIPYPAKWLREKRWLDQPRAVASQPYKIGSSL